MLGFVSWHRKVEEDINLKNLQKSSKGKEMKVFIPKILKMF